MPSHSTHWKALILAFGLLFSCTPGTSAYVCYGKYVPFERVSLGRTFPQTNLGDLVCSLDKTDTVRDSFVANGVTCINDHKEGTLEMKGVNKLGKKWSLKLRLTAAGGALIEADLDGNGEKDLIAVLFTAACGIAPSTRLVFLMFDRRRTPKAFDITGYFAPDEDGALEDLRKVPGRRGAVLIEQVLAGYWDDRGGKNFWRTTVWEARSRSWISLKQFGTPDVCLPTYTLYAYNEPRHKFVNVRHKLEYSDADVAAIHPLPTGTSEDGLDFYHPVQ